MSLKVLKFGAVWCPPCQALKPIIEKLAEEMEDVEFVSVDIDDESKIELVTKYKITAVPTMIFLKDDVVADSMVGLHKESVIKAKIEELK